nr:hypothetical protein [Tanacetum cinerariifolium]
LIFSEVEMPPRKRAYFTTPAFRFEVKESSAVGADRQPGLDVVTPNQGKNTRRNVMGIITT